MTLANTMSLIRLASVPMLLIAFYAPSESISPSQIPSRLGAFFCFVILLLGVISDALDGYLARSRREVTRMGKLLDPFADSLTFVTVFACFADIGYMGIWMFWLILAREVSMHFFLRPYFQIMGVVLAAKTAGKVKTVLQSIISLVLLAFLVLIGGPPDLLSPTIINYVRTGFYLAFGVVTLISWTSMSVYLSGLRTHLRG